MPPSLLRWEGGEAGAWLSAPVAVAAKWKGGLEDAKEEVHVGTRGVAGPVESIPCPQAVAAVAVGSTPRPQAVAATTAESVLQQPPAMEPESIAAAGGVWLLMKGRLEAARGVWGMVAASGQVLQPLLLPSGPPHSVPGLPLPLPQGPGLRGGVAGGVVGDGRGC